LNKKKCESGLKHQPIRIVYRSEWTPEYVRGRRGTSQKKTLDCENVIGGKEAEGKDRMRKEANFRVRGGQIWEGGRTQ